MKNVRVGIIGFGGRGANLAEEMELAANGMMQATAAVEPDSDGFERIAKQFGCRPERYGSIAEMLSAGNVDAVLIASPNSCHLENLRALQACGLPILLEKPLDAGWESICELVRWTETYPSPIMVGHCMRYAPILRRAKAMIEAGEIGRVRSARFVQNCHYGNIMFHSWRREKAKSGTNLIEKATHDFDIMLWLLDAVPLSVFASQKLQVFGGDKDPNLRCRDCQEALTCKESTYNISNRWCGRASFFEMKAMNDWCVYSSVVDTPDDDICLIQFDSGVHATYEQTFYSPRSFHHRDYQITGDEGAMDIDMGAEEGGNILLCKRFGTTADTERYHFDYKDAGHYNSDVDMLTHFYEVAALGVEPLTTVRQAFIAEALGYAAVGSSEEERLVRLSEIVPDDLRDKFLK